MGNKCRSLRNICPFLSGMLRELYKIVRFMSEVFRVTALSNTYFKTDTSFPFSFRSLKKSIKDDLNNSFINLLFSISDIKLYECTFVQKQD